jgi:uncharacterized protein
VATLRYDKLGSGQTGLGPYANDPDSIGIAPFEQEAAAALRFLAGKPGVNQSQLGVFGHSEGALFALLLADGYTGGTRAAPHVHTLGLIEPLSERYLDIITVQVGAQVAAAQKAGQLTAARAASLTQALARAIAQLRSAGTVPSGLPAALSSVLSPSTALYLSQADRHDPASLAAKLPAGTPVLVTCSKVDAQVSCGEVQHLRGGLAEAPAKTDFRAAQRCRSRPEGRSDRFGRQLHQGAAVLPAAPERAAQFRRAEHVEVAKQLAAGRRRRHSRQP